MTVFFKDRDDLMEVARNICSENNAELVVVDRPIVSNANDETVSMYTRKAKIIGDMNDLESITSEVINQIIENDNPSILYLYQMESYPYLGDSVAIRYATE